MLTFKALHILSMVTMVTVFIGVEIFYAAAIWQRDVRALAWVHRVVERIFAGQVAILALIAGIVFGLLTAADGGFDYVAGWLVAAYVLVAAFFVNAAVLGARLVHLARRAVEADAGRLPVEEVEREFIPSRGVMLVAINATLFAAIIADMVLKPF